MKSPLLITYYWPPSGGPGVQRWLKFLKYFPENDYKPYVITVDPKYASYPIIDQSFLADVHPELKVFRTKTSEIYGIYKKITGREEIPYSGFANEKKHGFADAVFRIIRGNFFIPDPRKGWNKYAIEKAISLIEQGDINCIITTSPPHSSQLIGLQLKHKTGLPWIADLRDPWTDIYYYKELKRTGTAFRIDKGYEKRVLETADQVVVVSEQIKHDLLKKSDNIRAGKIAVIPNGFDEQDFKSPSAPSKERFIVTYTGTLSEEYAIDGFLNALSKITEVKQILYCIRFVGNMPEEMKDKILKILPLGNVEFISHVDHNEAISYMLSSSALLLVIPKVNKNKGILTGKLFEYLASGKPIIGIGPDDGDAAAIINKCEAGKMLLYNRIDEISDHLASLIKQWKQDPNIDINPVGRDAYSRRNLSQQYLKIIKSVC